MHTLRLLRAGGGAALLVASNSQRPLLGELSDALDRLLLAKLSRLRDRLSRPLAAQIASQNRTFANLEI